MKIKGLTLQQIEAAAREAGHFKLDNVRQIGNYTFFVLRMASNTPSASERKWMDRSDTVVLGGTESSKYRALTGRMKFRKYGISYMMHGRGPRYGAAVCFHGFRAFMRECFKRNPHAIIRTAKAAYLGSEDFEAKWPRVGAQNVGSQVCPVAYSECCDC